MDDFWFTLSLRSPLQGQLKLLKITPDNFLDFSAGVAMDGEVRATQDAKAEMRIKIDSVKTAM